ncbi:hypothetical protein A3A76_04230 [Candidatus Woesebacteria bacterium RIFCSPLOWO2_01_FULL_39_23]|uniref:SHS2 domain-containing protein n=1 Tax=Candidatus Woesebacteria bacterium RIFCSPHIGHO2_01_FULL_40_22 TaxID=1802499 RepID=A0A1F7YFL3_9BACT|nr:MAG: hypothetical protein A2141_01795 [Candidatus Woesebacteria bacterium RBG_16_40_11]OGM25960.1 MAG: hypothetical protein A2628_00230 [Candidatus Woesebacteria bacterium RIFCSPHIGHO2_01_FULL_40_22]OGM61809.1 MAG: hypothetical protein A3A76_04230 [Candidatus Woesebacteria bacterium RIFCSPLOWO2_01_FULL_39_23]
MNKKAFVSLFFSSDKLQVVKLSAARKKVETFATIDLPNGLIVNHEVKDTDALGGILKKLWSKLHLREKSVGIVVPEFSTFIKGMNMPKLEGDELDEAVRWHAEEFLPIDPKEMIVDWKIIGSDAFEYQVLLVAIKESILAGYVNAAASAGLYPLVVETPSISLARVANTPQAKIILYTAFDEIILVLTVSEKVITSSVLSYDNATEVISTVNRMMHHYKDLNIESIYVGGVGINTDFLNDLGQKSGVKLEKISVPVSGMTADDVQRYIVPVSLQFKDPAEPVSAATINLLPEPVVKKYEKKRLNLQIWSLLMLVTLMVVASFLTTLGSYIYMTQQISSQKSKVVNVVTANTKNKDASMKIKAVNDNTDKVMKILSLSTPPQEAFNAIYKSKPAGVTLSSYRVDLEKNTISIAGISATRDDLIAFKQEIEKSGVFGKVTLPLAAFEVQNDLNFSLNFTYLNPSAVKK